MDHYKSSGFISGHWVQQFKIKFNFVSFYPVVREGQWYDDSAPEDLILRCESFG